MAHKVNTAHIISQTQYIVRDLQSLVDIIHLDHAYAKPWSAHPEASKARPVKRLFLPKPDNEVPAKLARKQKENEIVDVCAIDSTKSSSTIMFDTAKAKTAMAECEKHVSAVSSRRTPDTWEEQINRLVCIALSQLKDVRLYCPALHYYLCEFRVKCNFCLNFHVIQCYSERYGTTVSSCCQNQLSVAKIAMVYKASEHKS